MGKPCLEKPLDKIIAPFCKKSMGPELEFTHALRVNNIDLKWQIVCSL